MKPPNPLSVSVGLATSTWDEANLSLRDLVNRADTAMYAQKQRRQRINMAAIKASQCWSRSQVNS